MFQIEWMRGRRKRNKRWIVQPRAHALARTDIGTRSGGFLGLRGLLASRLCYFGHFDNWQLSTTITEGANCRQ
jgi:hypothetical protein